MPTYEALPRFLREYDRLTDLRKDTFDTVVARFVSDLKVGHFRPGLRVRGVQGKDGVFEMTWAPDGRATFQYGTPVHEGDPHVIWRRIGTHDIFDEP